MATAAQLIVNGLISGAGYGLIAVSFAIIYNTTHFFHFAHAAVYTVAAYVALSLTAIGYLSTPAALLGSFAAAGLLGGLMELSVYRPLRNRKASPIILLLASLGLLIMLQNCISLIFGDGTKLLPGSVAAEGIHVLSARITWAQLTIVVVSFGLYSLVALVLRYSRAGRTMRAVGNEPELARIMGVDSARSILTAFMLGSLLVGVAAVLVAYDTGLRPTMGFNALLFGVVAMVVGGIGSVSGAFLGGLIIGFVQQTGAWVLPSKWQDVIVFLILTFFLILKPKGLLGKPLRRAAV